MDLLFDESSIEIYKSIIEYNPDAIFILTVGGEIVESNEAMTKIFGYTKEEIKDLHCNEMVVPEQAEEVNRHFEQVLQGVPCQYETTGRHKNGSILHLQVKKIPLIVNGEIIGALGVAKDMTELQKTKELLKECEKRYRRLVELSPEPIIVYYQGKIEFANPSCINLLGVTSLEDLLGKSITDYCHPESVDVIEKRIQELDHTGIQIAPTEEKMIRVDGTIIDVEVTGVTIDHDGKSAFLMIYHDITRRKRAERALRQSEENYRLIAENMTDLVCVINWDGVFKYASPSHVTVLGFPSEAYEGEHARDWMHQDDYPKVRKQLHVMVETKDSCVFEYRFRNIKGSWVWLEGKATPVFDEDGHVQYFLVVSREITERKFLQEKLSHLAYHDALTGLPNRRLLRERLKQSLKEAQRYQRKLAILYMDMDRFKHINDTLGHDVGDELLKQFAQRVKGCLRERDTVARQGGDEFIVLLPEIQEELDALQIAKRILSSLQEPWYIGQHVLQTTSSIGISFYPNDGITRHELIKHADTALYTAKEEGKNKFKTYSILRKEMNYLNLTEKRQSEA